MSENQIPRQKPPRTLADSVPHADVIEGIYQASLESLLAGAEVVNTAIRSYVDADRQKRGAERGFQNLPDQVAKAARDAMEVLTEVPGRVWNAYEEGRTYVNDRAEDSDKSSTGGK